MEKNLLLEINKMRNLMGLSLIQEKINSIEKKQISLNENKIISAEKSLTNLNENRILLNEQLIKGIKGIWDEISGIMGKTNVDGKTFRELTNSIDELVMNGKTIQTAADNLKAMHTSIVDGVSDLQVQKDKLVTFFENRNLSKSIEDSWTKEIDNLSDDVKNTEVPKVRAGFKVTLGELLEKHKKKMVELYEEFEDVIKDRIDDPKKYGINNAEDMNKFADDLEETLEEEMPFFKDASGENPIPSNVRKSYSPDNLSIDLNSSFYKRWKSYFDEIFNTPNMVKFKESLRKFFKVIYIAWKDYVEKFFYQRSKARWKFWKSYETQWKSAVGAEKYKLTNILWDYGLNGIVRYIHIGIAMIDTLINASSVFLTTAWRAMVSALGNGLKTYLYKNFSKGEAIFGPIVKVITMIGKELGALIIGAYYLFPYNLNKLSQWLGINYSDESSSRYSREEKYVIFTTFVDYWSNPQKLLGFGTLVSTSDTIIGGYDLLIRFLDRITGQHKKGINERKLKEQQSAVDDVQNFLMENVESSVGQVSKKYNTLQSKVKQFKDCLNSLKTKTLDGENIGDSLPDWLITENPMNSADQSNAEIRINDHWKKEDNETKELMADLIQNKDITSYMALYNKLSSMTTDFEQFKGVVTDLTKEDLETESLLDSMIEDADEAMDWCNERKTQESGMTKEKVETGTNDDLKKIFGVN